MSRNNKKVVLVTGGTGLVGKGIEDFISTGAVCDVCVNIYVCACRACCRRHSSSRARVLTGRPLRDCTTTSRTTDPKAQEEEEEYIFLSSKDGDLRCVFVF